MDKAQKFERKGPQEFVAFPYEDINVPNIIKAYNTHFKMTCDILPEECGPSCSRIDQLANLKVIHSSFVRTDQHSAMASQLLSADLSNCAHPSLGGIHLSAGNNRVIPRSFSVVPSKRKADTPFKTPLPKSLCVTQMLKLGKVITTTTKQPTAIQIAQFDLEKLAWSAPKLAHFEIEEMEL
eukprot:gene718-16396_t